MLTLPTIIDRAAQPYIAIREKVTIPFNDAVDRVFGELFAWLSTKGIAPAGPAFMKYDLIDMPRLEIEFGVPLKTAVAGEGKLVPGTLPAGRYAESTYWGHYSNLMDFNAVMIGWAKEKGIRWDSKVAPEGEQFACRMEIYVTDPREEPDPEKWETQLVIKVAE